MLRAENYIDLNTLRAWTQTWDEQQYIHYFEHQISDWEKRFKVRTSMEENIVKIKKVCRDLGEELTFHSYLQLLNRIIFNCYFKQGNSALRIANFYEEIILPADQETRMKMFSYHAGKREVGSLNLHMEGQTIGQLGEQSDVFHLVYDASFLTEEELFDNEQAIVTQKKHPSSFSITSVDDDFLTLKIWKPELLDLSLHRFVDHFLYYCSTRLHLNFKRVLLESPCEQQGKPLRMDFSLQPLKLDELPLLYFNAAAHHSPPQIRYLNYFHAISYFQDKATDLILRDKMQDLLHVAHHPGQTKKILKSLASLRETFSEQEALELLLRKALAVDTLERWLDAEPGRREWFCQSHPHYPALPALELASPPSTLSHRLCLVRQSLESYSNPSASDWLILDEDVLLRELPLMKFLAARVIESWSTIPAVTHPLESSIEVENLR